MNDEERAYVIFARKSYDEPLTETGIVKARSIEQVRESALAAYPDDDWLEMVAIPQAAFVQVFEEA